jgi:aryl-alcohol dehydrogenase-like predicted oxidoreductase
LWSCLERLKADGLAARIGVSVYHAHEIDRILDRYPIDIIQLPFSAVDTRLADGGQLGRLAQTGVEVHARSLFLQGLLLAPADDIPDRFAPVRAAVRQLDAQFSRQGLSRLEGLLAMAFSHAEIDRFVVGVTSAAELNAIIVASRAASRVKDLQVPALAGIDERLLNPARWGEIRERTGKKGGQ